MTHAVTWQDLSLLSLFFFNDTATTEIYTLSLHDALPICNSWRPRKYHGALAGLGVSSGLASRSSGASQTRSEEHTSELQSHSDLVCRLLLEKKNTASEGWCIRS